MKKIESAPKKLKKLDLKREAVRTLTNDELMQVGGGNSSKSGSYPSATSTNRSTPI